MATAKRVPSAPPPPDHIVLELTEEEASFIRFLVGKKVIGGGHWRNVNDTVYTALADARVPSIEVPEVDPTLRIRLQDI